MTREEIPFFEEFVIVAFDEESYLTNGMIKYLSNKAKPAYLNKISTLQVGMVAPREVKNQPSETFTNMGRDPTNEKLKWSGKGGGGSPP